MTAPHLIPVPRTGRLLVVLSAEAVGRIVQQAPSLAPAALDDLGALGDAIDFPGLGEALAEHGSPRSFRAIRSLSLSRILVLDRISREGPFPPVRSLLAYWIVDTRGAEPVSTDTANALLRVPGAVEAVYREEAPGPPPAVTWWLNPFAYSQHHLDPAPTGIDAKWAWATLGVDGAGIDFADVEQGWNTDHDEFKTKPPVRLTPAAWDNPTYRNHGTAVLGLVAGADNGAGIIGIAPGVHSVRLVSHWDGTTDANMADAIAKAADNLVAGDVLLLEIQGGVGYPVERVTGGSEMDAIKAATNKGIIVIEPAGNYVDDLDLAFTDGWPDDSGTIMVGASVGDPPGTGFGSIAHAPIGMVGSRINCFATGLQLVSAGKGDMPGSGPGTNQAYTNSFGATSGASAIVAGAALLVQHMYMAAAANARLTPAAMRVLLSTNGTPQGAPNQGNIGTMPDLRRIAGRLVDVYLRDYVGDTGVVPSTGPLSSSPDVIVRGAAVADPQGSFGAGSGTENSDTLGQTVLVGNDHQLYVRVLNRGMCPAIGATATVYWSEVATLVLPNTWNLIGSSSPFNVPKGDTLTVAPAIPWPAAAIPASGHYCFVATVNHPYDPAPPPPPPNDWDAFLEHLRQFNNITWRNFNVLDPEALMEGTGAWFSMRGAPDQARIFDFEVEQRLPLGVTLALEVPLVLAPALRGPFVRIGHAPADEVRIVLPELPVVRFVKVRLAQNATHRCRFVLADPHDRGVRLLAKSSAWVSIRQLYQGVEVGRITWTLPPRRLVE
jgi:serine protease